jgi:hypothetical protein
MRARREGQRYCAVCRAAFQRRQRALIKARTIDQL